MSRTICTLLLATGLLLTGCKSDPAPKGEPAPAQPAKPAPAAPKTAKVYPVACGCSLPEVGKCGEFAKVDGAFIKIENHGLGSMPFCGKTGLSAKIRGTVSDGTLKAESVEVVK